MIQTHDSDTLQQIHDAIGEEPCIGSVCGGKNTGPDGICKDCRADFLATFRNRDTYERIAFGFDERDRFTPDRMADVIFGKVQPLPPAERARKLAIGGDPRAVDLATELLGMDDGPLLTTVGLHKAEAEKIEAQAKEMVDEYAAPHRLIVNVGEAVIKDRLRERGGKLIPDDYYDCHLTASKDIDKRMDVLLGLFEILSAKQLEGALWISGIDASEAVKDPEKLKKILEIEGVKPVYSAHAGNLRKLARDAGGEVKKIVDKGVIDSYKAPTLVFTPKESAQKNVTPPSTQVAAESARALKVVR